ncbi:hypothetical protein BDV06DRAFT_182460 [Aspergillus oleicola]
MSFKFRIILNAPSVLLFLLLLLLLSPSICAAEYPPCIQSCITSHRSNSWCSGNETGRAQDECLCRGLDGRPIIECIRDCEPIEQWQFAGDLPGTCRARLFPEAREEDDGDADDDEEDTGSEGGVEAAAGAIGVNIGMVGLVTGLLVVGCVS